MNIAGPHFQQPGFTEFVNRTLEGANVSPSLLELEVTESMLMDDRATTFGTMSTLKSMGLRLSIDDFGTGYSSLAYLKRFPVHALKVDRSFVKDMPHAEDDSAITSAIIAMAHSLRLEVVAEGVETTEQLNYLNMRHCDYAQGYLISRPVPAAALSQFVRDRLAAKAPAS